MLSDEEEVMSTKQYLGDGVYVCTDGYGLVVTTENGVEATNTVYLEPKTLEALMEYVKNIKG